ncbi:SLBB domain-containing protein [Mucilaginibacter sp. UR6-11]|uniref:SLBB domain-containing protein n=1 Tax=Mucilaginibacter sp. UR6-11 TaxID=1435644 RepID=UPI001E4DFF17|nr:SLBB domain-containing protein [Mucilaginibacter sp. UR6-11]MCC8423982.1 SLBB domain-containing protein [Mucilaginibacter sp. UR6-11]
MNKFRIYLSILVVVFSLILSSSVFAQSLPQNMSSFNVDDYSDAQLKAVLQNAQSQGLNDSQLMQMAQSRGLPASQAQRLQSRLADIRRKDGSVSAVDTTGNTQSSRKLSNGDNNNQDSQGNTTGLFSDRSRIFGASLFRNSKANTFQPNLKLATPVNYIVGPDDKLHINVYGNSVANWQLTVTPEGNINIPGVGILNVAGKTIEQATVAIKSKLAANNYAVDRGTSVQVSLGDIRTINVILQGELMKPGTYSLSSLSTAFDALFAAGGPNDIGSFRKIEIIRNNKVVSKLDLYDFIVNGSRKSNIVLRDQDIIHVPPYGIHVELKGEVKVPAIFETLPGEKLQDILDYSGGFTDQAYTERIKVDQVNGQQHRFKDIGENDYKNYTPLRGDKYTVSKILDRYENRVIIDGAVFRPGEFELQDGLSVSKLIKNAGGLREDAFTGRGSIIRLNADNTIQQLSFNVQDVMSNPSADIVLQREDSISITSVFDLHDRYKVTIKGQVRRAGDFAYADSMKVADLILKAGGFAEGASARRIEVSRRVFDSDPSQKNSRVAQVYSVNVDANLKFEDINFSLKPFDIVSVYTLPGYETQKVVKVEGEVIFPGYYTIEKKNEKVSDLVKRAGGLTRSADIEGGSLKRDNAAVLGVDKTKVDTITLSKERAERIRRLQRSFKDTLSSSVDTSQFRNNYVGIDLKKILAHPGEGDDLILENGDVLRIPKEQQTVRVNGEVLYPSAVVYSSGKTFKGYVLNAGGFSPSALKRAAYVVYTNGTVKGTNKFLFFNIHPKVKPGSEIFVPKKLPGRGDTGQLILGYTTGLASLGAIILGILSLRK